MINILHGNCMDLMASKEDNYYDLAIVDPPYGIGMSKNPIRQKHKKSDWDTIPKQSYFNELFRVSKNQFIWGGNYFNLPPTQGFMIWDKKQPFDFTSSMCEYCWSSFQSPAKIYVNRTASINGISKIHPTQKPIALYKWLLKNYAKEGDKILDTHGGSMSSAIACHDYKYDLDIIELDKDYYEAGKKRFDNHVKQLTLF